MSDSNNSFKEYLALSPRDNLDESGSLNYNPNFEHYESKLLWALNNSESENIKNIAITGYYGAGKSSILKTFIKKHQAKEEKEKEQKDEEQKANNQKNKPNKKLKFLELSLATFHDDKEGHDKVNDIEKSLLQQMLYKVRDKDIPASRYKKLREKADFDIKQKLVIAIFLILVLTRVYNFFFSQDIWLLVKISDCLNLWLDKSFHFSPNTLIDLAIFTSLICLFYVFRKLIKPIGLKKISYQNLEAELNSKEDELSILSRFLDEIIYFFKKTEFNVVVIEDIDRFDSTEIFSNLRELNLILNSSDLIDNHITFIYAIKNEQFKTASDRTKFFDFIIPIIPIVNYETSANLFMKYINGNDNEYMIRDLFSLVDDARVINNTINEIKSYIALLGQTNYIEIKNDLYKKLIPLIFYKNVEPYDFSCLLKRKGFMYFILEKEKIIKTEKKALLQERINNTKEQIRNLEKESFNSLNEFKRFILSSLVTMTAKKNQIISSHLSILNDDDDKIKDFLNDEKLELFDEVFNAKSFKIIYHNSYNPHIILKEDLESQLNLKLSDRIALLKEKKNIKSKENEIVELENEINGIDKKPLHSIIDEEDLNSLLEENQNNNDKENTPNFEIVKMLIINGYIDNAYFLYLSNHADLQLSFNDHKFWLSIKNKININYDHKLDNPSKIKEKLSASDYNSSAILNFDFVNYYFESKGVINVKQRLLIIDQISKFEILEIDFLVYYLDQCENIELFIKLLSKKITVLWKTISENDKFETSLKQKFFEAIIKHADTDDIYKFSQNSDLKEYIRNHDDFLSLRSYSFDMKEIIEKLHLKLVNINFNSNRSVLDFIYTNNCYIINKGNIYGFYNYKINNQELKLKSQILTEITNNKDELRSMYNYIFKDQHLETFIDQLILEIPTNTKESESVLMGLLNNVDEAVSNTTKKRLIKHQDNLFSKIYLIQNHDLKFVALSEEKLLPTWGNILDIVDASQEEDNDKKASIDDDIVSFIGKNIDQFIEDFNDIDDKEKPILFFIGANKSNNETYRHFVKKIVEDFNFIDTSFNNLNNLNNDKVKILIEENYLTLSVDNLESLIDESHEELTSLLFEKNQNKILEILPTNSHISQKISIAALEANIKGGIKTELINLLYDEQPDLFENTKIINPVIRHLIKTKGNNFNHEVKHFLSTLKFDSKYIAQVFNIISSVLDKNQIKTFFSNQSDKEYEKLSKHRYKPKFENTDENMKMLNKLKGKNIISDFKIEKHINKLRVKYVNNY